MRSSPIHVAVLHTGGFPARDIEVAIRSAGMEATVVGADFVTSTEVRLAKARGDSFDEIRLAEPQLTTAQRDAFSRAEVLLALDVPHDILAVAPHVRWIQAITSGTAHIQRCVDARVVVTSTSGVGAPSMAEFVMARVLQAYKGLRELDVRQRSRTWSPVGGCSLAGRTIGIVGLGAVGCEVARRAAAFDMQVIGTRRHVGEAPPPFVDEVRGPDGLAWLLASADVVVLAAAATAETEQLLGAAELGMMRDGSIPCNVARGSMLDERALVDALAGNRPAAAILDVTAEEPLAVDSPLWDHPGVYLSPHCSVSFDQYASRVLALFIDNLDRFVRGVPLRNVVDRARGY